MDVFVDNIMSVFQICRLYLKVTRYWCAKSFFFRNMDSRRLQCLICCAILGGSFFGYIALGSRFTTSLHRRGYQFIGLLFFVGLRGVSSAFGRDRDVHQ